MTGLELLLLLGFSATLVGSTCAFFAMRPKAATLDRLAAEREKVRAMAEPEAMFLKRF